jgi:hypothetical protein
MLEPEATPLPAGDDQGGNLTGFDCVFPDLVRLQVGLVGQDLRKRCNAMLGRDGKRLVPLIV